MKGEVERQTPESKFFQYRLDHSFNADHPRVVTAERKIGFQGDDRLDVGYRFQNGSGSLVSMKLNRDQTEMLRDVLNAALADWQ